MERAVPAMIFGRSLDVVGVEVSHLGLADFASLIHRDRTNLDGVGGAGTLLDASSLLDELSGGRRLEDEREGTILVTVISTGMMFPRCDSVAAL